MVPLDVDALGRRVLDRQRPQVAVRAEGHRPSCGSARTGASGSTRWSCRTAPTTALAGRTRFRHEFDWVGTADPTGYLTLPAAIDWMARRGADGGGWPAVMAANHALALEGRDRRRGGARHRAAPAPDAMLGSMAALPLAARGATTRRPRLCAAASRTRTGSRSRSAAGRCRRPGARASRRGSFVRISAQRYNEPADYERLAEALVRRLASLRLREGLRRPAETDRRVDVGIRSPASRTGPSVVLGVVERPAGVVRAVGAAVPCRGSRPRCRRESGATASVVPPIGRWWSRRTGAVVLGDADGSGLGSRPRRRRRRRRRAAAPTARRSGRAPQAGAAGWSGRRRDRRRPSSGDGGVRVPVRAGWTCRFHAVLLDRSLMGRRPVGRSHGHLRTRGGRRP